MTKIKRPRLVRKKKLHFYGGRGELYAWLRTHHDEIQSLLEHHLNLWAELALDLVEDGVATPTEGRDLRDRIRQAWQRVQRDVEAEAKVAKAKPTGGRYPSRIFPDWRPQTAPPPLPIYPSAPLVSGTMRAATGALPAGAKDESREGLEELYRAMEMLREHDRQKFRFG